jgi:Domain of unknown function (DUF4124)
MFRILAIAAILFGITAAAYADVWRWTDPEGHVQYSDRWVPGSVLIKTDKANPGGTDPNATDQQKLAASNASIADQQEHSQAEQTVKNDVAKQKDAQCKKDSADYEKAIQSRRLYKEDKDGQRTYATDAEAEAYRLQLFNQRKASCGK